MPLGLGLLPVHRTRFLRLFDLASWFNHIDNFLCVVQEVSLPSNEALIFVLLLSAFGKAFCDLSSQPLVGPEEGGVQKTRIFGGIEFLKK